MHHLCFKTYIMSNFTKKAIVVIMLSLHILIKVKQNLTAKCVLYAFLTSASDFNIFIQVYLSFVSHQILQMEQNQARQKRNENSFSLTYLTCICIKLDKPEPWCLFYSMGRSSHKPFSFTTASKSNHSLQVASNFTCRWVWVSIEKFGLQCRHI